jgi:hypothetical protein
MPATRHSHRGHVQPIVAVALGAVAIVGIVAAVLVSRPANAAPIPSARPSAPASPTAVPTPTPTPTPVPTATPNPTPKPTPTPAASPTNSLLTVDLQNLTNHDVSVQIQDPNSIVVGARSGQPGDGMSVRWHDSIVENLERKTIAVTFVGLPQDEVADLVVDDLGNGKLHLTLVQTGPVPYSDAMGEDRILILDLDHVVDADDVSVEILDRTID